jgi:hypothetical protein
VRSQRFRGEGRGPLQRGHAMTKAILVVFLSLGCGVIAAGKTITKQELVQMQRSGLSSETIAAAVEANGLAFDLDAGALIELRGMGIPDELLKSVFQASGRAKSTQREYDVAKDLLKSGRIDSAADAINTVLKANPADLKARSLLVYVLLRQNKFEDAEKEIHTIESAPDASQFSAVIAQLRTFDTARRGFADLRAQVNAKLRAYDGDGAAELIRTSTLGAPAKAAVLFEVALLQGRFDDCRKMLQQKELQDDAETVAKLEKGLRETEERVQAARNQLAYIQRTNFFAWYGYDVLNYSIVPIKKLTENFPNEKFSELAGCIDDRRTKYYRSKCALEAQLRMDLSEIETYAGLLPLNAEAQNWLFFHSLLTRSYEETAAIGKQILAVNSSLKIPFEYKTGYGYLILDQKAGLLKTEQGESIPKYDDRYMDRGFDLFSIRFDKITQIEQKGNWRVASRLGSEWVFHPTFLKFSDSAVVPLLPMVEHITFLYGQTAARQIVHNLGQFVKDVINKPDLKTALMSTQARQGGFLDALMIGMAGAMNPNLRPMATQAIQSQQAARDRDPLGSAAWQQMAIEQPFQAFWKGIEDKLDSVGEAILK